MGNAGCCGPSEDKASLTSDPYHGVSQAHMGADDDFSKAIRQADQGPLGGMVFVNSKGTSAAEGGHKEDFGPPAPLPQPPVTTAPAAQSTEYMIVLDKAHGQSLGVDVDLADGQSMLVDKLDSVGLIADWNKRNPDKQVCINHRIVEVNGVRGNAQMMTVRAKNDSILKIVLSHT
mmetsp:Transcript_30049/g.70029  ORF Transcript_30049/g.70029 Transcript_30049/m.70029 type:complete len:175 (-) Transcript_30049:98-622(-)